MASYILRDIDPGLWDKFKARALKEGRGLKFVVLRLVELYSKHGLEAIEDAVKK